jgi:hypothetical protein
MPLYFFHVYDDLVARDDDGLELPDASAAVSEAVRAARAIAAEQVSKGYLKLDHRIEVENAGGLVGTVTFRDAVAVQG